MSVNMEHLQEWLVDIANVIEQNQSLDQNHYNHFIQEPELAHQLVDVLVAMEEQSVDEAKPFYSACVFAIEVCISHMQAGLEADSKVAAKMLEKLMHHLSQCMLKSDHTLTFWMPVINAFYEVHVELSEELKEAYFELVSQEDTVYSDDDTNHLNAIRELITELSDLSPFDITENFFAQSYALPPEFFSDLVADLYSIEEGREIALLTLLHPKYEVREIVVATIDMLIDQITLSPTSLSRLQAIKHWYPESYHTQFDHWIKQQRKLGVTFQPERKIEATVRIKASEVDGSGAQGIFIHYLNEEQHRLCGLLYKKAYGIKDAWFTPNIPEEDVVQYYNESFEETIMLREVDLAFVQLMTNHFIAVGIEQNILPDLHLLEIQEALGVSFIPQAIQPVDLLNELTVKIHPFTPERVSEALKRTKTWSNTKRFTESWFVESPEVDTIVNQHSSIQDGIKVCHFESAFDAVFEEAFEKSRDDWMFHFLWVSLWLKPQTRANEKTWEDALLIAHCIHSGLPLKDIPIMEEIGKQTVLNSIETMNERRTHLTRQS